MKKARWRSAVWVMILFSCAFCGVMTMRSPTRREIAIWSSPRKVTSAGTHANGIFAISRDGLLWVGIESVTWFGWASDSSSRTFPSPISPAGFTFESRQQLSSRSNELGFWATNYVDWRPAYRNHQRLVRMPWWFVWMMLTLAVGGVYCIWWRRVPLREMRMRNGLCIGCGYDLRASQGRCPECGLGKIGS